MVPGIVLAAGASSRMGTAKALLRAGNSTFIARILEAFRGAGVPSAVVVVRPGADDIAAEVARFGFGTAVTNPRADEGQLSSLLAGLDAIDRAGVEAALVTLVDVPLITAAAVRRLVDRAQASDAVVLRVVHDGRHGHPVLFKRAVFDALRRADPALGAKAVLRAVRVEDVDVAEPGVVEDVDTPEDYRRLRGILSP